MDCFVFRQDVETFGPDLYREIQQGRLRQGWSWEEGLSLLQDEDTCIRKYAGMLKCSVLDARKRYQLLRPMTQVKEGDVLVVPKQLDSNHFLILTASRRETLLETEEGECYSFKGPLGKDLRNDYRHVVQIHADSVRCFDYDAISVPSIIKSRLKGIAYSRPITRVGSAEFILAILECYNKVRSSEDLQPATVAQRARHEAQSARHEAQSAAYKQWIKKISTMSNSDFEKLFHQYVTEHGYTIFAKNQCDGKGGDIDFACERAYEISTPLETITEQVVYLIQVKKKIGIDQNDVAGVQQLVQQRPKFEDRGGRIQAVLMSSADDFTDECKKEAKANDVKLIGGEELAAIYLKNVIS